MKKQLIELGKTLLIVFLIVTLTLLTLAALPAEMLRSDPTLSSVLRPFAPLLGLPQAELAYVEEAQPVSDAAKPLSISVSRGSGRHTAMWDFAALDLAYETLGGLLGEALDTSHSYTAVRQELRTSVLSKPGVCFDYGFPISAQLLASWLDAAPAEQLPAAQRYILTIEDDAVILYLQGTGFGRVETRLDVKTVLALLDQFKADGSAFAFETDSHLSALTLIPGSDPAVQAASSSSPCDTRFIENLATELGFNPYSDASFTDSSGVTWFSETNCSLQVSSSGEILLTSTEAERFQAPGDSMEILVEEARALVELAVGEVMGDARIYLSGVRQEGEQTICTFQYVLNGIPVFCGEEPAATVIFSGSAMTEFRMLAARFVLTGEPLKVLPHAQVCAMIPTGGTLRLEYDRLGPGALQAGWK